MKNLLIARRVVLKKIFIQIVVIFFHCSNGVWVNAKNWKVNDYATTNKAELNWKNLVRLNGTSSEAKAETFRVTISMHKHHNMYVCVEIFSHFFSLSLLSNDMNFYPQYTRDDLSYIIYIHIKQRPWCIVKKYKKKI